MRLTPKRRVKETGQLGDVFAILSQGFVEDGVIECPLHAAQFEIATGRCLSGPASQDLRVYEVRLDGDDVYVAARA